MKPTSPSEGSTAVAVPSGVAVDRARRVVRIEDAGTSGEESASHQCKEGVGRA